MRTLATCMQCQKENRIPNFASIAQHRIPDDGVIEISCDRGHRTALVIQQTKFEILSELAVSAICDECYREAVSAFASSLERLYEFYVRVVCRAHGIESEKFTSAWKPLRWASERQLGAFAMLYLLENAESFSFLRDTQIYFRNDVIHNGRIPDRAETLAYGQAVMDCAAPLIALLRSRYEKESRAVSFEDLAQKSAGVHERGIKPSTQSMYTPLSLTFSPLNSSLEAVLAERAQWPGMTGSIALARAFAEQKTLANGDDPGTGKFGRTDYQVD